MVHEVNTREIQVHIPSQTCGSLEDLGPGIFSLSPSRGLRGIMRIQGMREDLLYTP